jgi:hypothetical protein
MRHDGRVADAELLSEAIAELYAADPDAFTERRGVLAAQARAAGAAPVAKTIAGLRRPTRSAWIINQLVRDDPSVPVQLAALGDELRAAEAALDGTKIRELSLARRQLIDALVRRALAGSGQSSPPAALREEVTATFGAALADPQVAEQLTAGTLLRAERRAGFGSGGASALAFVSLPAGRLPSPAVAEPAAPASAAAKTAATAAPAAASRAAAAEAASAETAAAETAAAEAAAAKTAAAKTAAAARASAERERRRAIADAELAVTRARQAADAAATVEGERESAVQLIEEQLADARRRLNDARIAARQANSAQRTARQKLDRLHG